MREENLERGIDSIKTLLQGGAIPAPLPSLQHRYVDILSDVGLHAFKFFLELKLLPLQLRKV
ncbi:hypothetical protein ABAC402_11290 [Asticcacaulis sp. AC402]|nr:hypothetical protein ABAC402_11290 [Asticcacaulis sp. AC402]